MNAFRQSFNVSGRGENVHQRVIPENWEVALNGAVADYIENFREAMLVADQK